MIRVATIFQNYTPYSRNYTIRIGDGTSFVVISKDLTLDSVLLVLNLDCNLLSISKLT